jgi:hypothetical protein
MIVTKRSDRDLMAAMPRSTSWAGDVSGDVSSTAELGRIDQGGGASAAAPGPAPAGLRPCGADPPGRPGHTTA